MIIHYPKDDFDLERAYTLDLLFNSFLGGKFQLEAVSGIKDYHILIGDSEITICDQFFAEASATYYDHLENLPKTYFEYSTQFAANLKSIYGSNKEILNDNKLWIGADLIGTAFYLLAGWEEYTLQQQGKVDLHGRADETELFLIKTELYKAPIINEYVEFLRGALSHFGVHISNPHKYRLVLTHDIDHIYKWKSLKGSLKSLAGLIIKGKIGLFVKSLKNIAQSGFDKTKDLYFNFDYILNTLKKNKISGYFFFMTANKSHKDDGYNVYDTNIQKVLEQLKLDGHHIGFHPGYSTSVNTQEFNNQLSVLKKATASPILYGRQHYLKYKMPETFLLWENQGFDWESSRGFSNYNGFKCGVCYPFPIFDFLQKKKLTIMEYPLMFMETNVPDQYTSLEKLKEDVLALISLVKGYNGCFVALWHNSNFIWPPYDRIADLYELVINEGADV